MFHTAVCDLRNTDKDGKRQSAMGQIGGMIDDIRPVDEFIEGMIAEAALLAGDVSATANA